MSLSDVVGRKVPRATPQERERAERWPTISLEIAICYVGQAHDIPASNAG